MNPSIHRRAVIVGLFVILAIAILAGGILMVGNLKDAFTQRITVSAVFDEVNGLKQGDNIWFSGLKIGIVGKLRFGDAAQVDVSMHIDQDAAEHIPADVQATIGSDGLIGNRIVVLKGGTPGSRVLADGDVLSIGEAVSSEALMAMLQENNTNLLAITTDLKGITGRIARGEGSVGKLLDDDQLYDDVTQTVSTLKGASANARGLTASLASFAADLNRPGALPKDLVQDRTSYASLQETVAQLHSAGDSAAELMSGLARGASDPHTAIGTLAQDQQAGADLKRTLANLNQSSALLSQDLEALQHNFLFRRYFRRKERAAARAASDDDADEP